MARVPTFARSFHFIDFGTSSIRRRISSIRERMIPPSAA
jgi:hypothetical protein